MVTGDNKDTAVSIANEVNLLEDGLVLTSDEMNKLSDESLKK